MRQQYRIITELAPDNETPMFCVQTKLLLGIWVTIKIFYDIDDHIFARLEAEELLEKLNEN